MTTLTELLCAKEIRGSFAAFHEALESVAAPPLQNAGTVGGNLCQNSRCLFYNQSKTWREEQPACLKAGGDVCLAVPGGKKCFSVYQGDLACALMAFGARIKVQKKGASRVVPLDDIFSGDAHHPIGLGNDETITEVLLAVPAGRTGSAYRKLRMRSAIDYPLVSVAAAVSLNGRGTISRARLVLGACGPAPAVAHDAEAILVGKEPKQVDLDAAGQAVARGAQLVNNLELPASYRRAMIPVFARRAIEAAIQDVLGKERS
jgi:CO/xanthine dehydrogenase FAD-binding subunit